MSTLVLSDQLESNQTKNYLLSVWFWFLGLLPPALLLLAITLFLTSPLRFVQPEFSGLTPDAHKIGQSFKPEHKGLRSITVLLPPATKGEKAVVPDGINLIIRDLNSSNRVVTSPGVLFEENRLRFNFIPLETQSSGNLLYFEVEANNIPFKLEWTELEVYPNGTAFVDGAAQKGDLAFELEYQPDPAGLFETYFQRQNAYGESGWAGLIAVAGWLTLVGSGGAFLIWHRANLSAEKVHRMTWRQFKPIALYFLALGVSGGLAFLFLTPPLQGLDEQGHLGRTVYVYQYHSDPAGYPNLFKEEYKLESQARYVEYVPGFSYDRPALEFAFVGPLSEFYQPPVYYSIAGGLVNLGEWLTGSRDLLLALRMTRLASLLFGVAGLVFALLWVYSLRREAAWLLLAVPTAYTVLPFYLFSEGVTNNDNAVNCFTALLILTLTLLYKNGHTFRYRREFWKKGWPLAVIALGSVPLAYFSKQSGFGFLVGLSAGVFIYFLSFQKKAVRNRILFGLAVLGTLVGILLILWTPAELKPAFGFILNSADKNRLLLTAQVLILGNESWWCTVGWVNFSDFGNGRLIVGLFWVLLIALWGVGREARRVFKARRPPLIISRTISPLNNSNSWIYYLSLTLGLAVVTHLFFLFGFRVYSSYWRFDGVIDFPQGRFLLLALIPLSALFFGGIRAVIPKKIRNLFPHWSGFYLWWITLEIYALILLFGAFLPYYYNLN